MAKKVSIRSKSCPEALSLIASTANTAKATPRRNMIASPKARNEIGAETPATVEIGLVRFAR
jgi:hypothetical protein